MLSTKFIRENTEAIKDTIKRQKKEEKLALVDKLLELDEEWRNDKKKADDLRHERNKVSESINKTKKEGGDIKTLIQKAKSIPAEIKALEEKNEQAIKEMRKLRSQIPNIMHKEVPYGASDEDNPTEKEGGVKKNFDFEVKNHVELTETLGIADFEAASEVSGNGFYYLKGDLALLNQALIRFAVDFMQKKEYEYIEPPLMIRKHILDAAMDSEGFEQSIYKVVGEEDEEDPLCLIGTAEHAILGMLEGKTIEEDKLPMKLYGYSMCFRQEIGSHGINEKGLWRTHQFNKVEQFIFCTPQQSWEMYEELKNNSEELLVALELPYRIIEICTGDLALWKARSHDFEVYRPTTKNYGEVMSLSNCTTYQAEELGIRYVKKDGERGTIHTLNNTALATSRIMVAILENYQNKDGSVDVPKVLQPYMGGKERITPKI